VRIKLPALIERCRHKTPRRIAVAAAGDAPVLTAVVNAYNEGVAVPILFGKTDTIHQIARQSNLDISAFRIIEADGDLSAVAGAVSMVRNGDADVLMKGLVQTADLLRGVLNKEAGLRGSGVISHVAAIDCDQLDRTILLTDCAICTYPDLKTKVQIINNAVAVANGIGTELPKIALLAAVEVINQEMPATLDAAALVQMNRRGQINGCVIDGPLALDGALSVEAAAHKKIISDVAGRADILLFHNIEAGNAAYKALTTVADCLAGGVVMGASAPIVLTSRADSSDSKLFSIALACASIVP
jgi:phosphate butyryltransferase